MHEKHSSEFAVIAVNARDDETRDDVSKYAAAANLKHPILLKGRSLAKDVYRVGAYPTTFWIDRNGMVADYEIGFWSGEALERHIKKMLK